MGRAERRAAARISIHAPPRGATRQLQSSFFFVPYFNSRPSARGDGVGGGCKLNEKISIHAPPRGATSLSAVIRSRVRFQFTPLREGRPAWYHLHLPAHYFNSRPSARGDLSCPRWIACGASISIHAPPRGATQKNLRKPLDNAFQFTPLREGRQPLICQSISSIQFQFTPLREGRPLWTAQ